MTEEKSSVTFTGANDLHILKLALSEYLFERKQLISVYGDPMGACKRRNDHIDEMIDYIDAHTVDEY